MLSLEFFDESGQKISSLSGEMFVYLGIGASKINDITITFLEFSFSYIDILPKNAAFP